MTSDDDDRTYNGKKTPGSTLYTALWNQPIRVLFIQTKAGTKSKYHQALGYATMHPPLVIPYSQAVTKIDSWPDPIRAQAQQLLGGRRSQKFKSFALTQKHEFKTPVEVTVPKGSVTFSRNFKKV